MERAPVADIGHGPQQHRIPLEGSIADGEVDPGQVLVDDAPGADIEVANLGVPLLTLWEADGRAGRGQDGVRPARPERIPVWLLRGSDRVAGRCFSIAPAVDDDEDERRPWPAYTRGDWSTSAVAWMIRVKSPALRLAPPISPPSRSGWRPLHL